MQSCLLLELLRSLHESGDDQPSSGLHQLLQPPHKNVQHGHLVAQTGNKSHRHQVSAYFYKYFTDINHLNQAGEMIGECL